MDTALRELRAAGIEVVGCAANVGSQADLKKLVDIAVSTFGTVDVLISNAAVNPAAGLILDMPDSAIEKILDVNVKSAIQLSREVRPHLRKVAQHWQPSCCWMETLLALDAVANTTSDSVSEALLAWGGA